MCSNWLDRSLVVEERVSEEALYGGRGKRKLDSLEHAGKFRSVWARGHFGFELQLQCKSELATEVEMRRFQRFRVFGTSYADIRKTAAERMFQ